MFRGASKVYAINKGAQRLAIAKQIGSIPVNVNDHKDVADYILSVEPHGLDKTVECSRFRSADSPQHKAMRVAGLEGNSLRHCLGNDQGYK
jgi:threonine dehydrogenase-like Zn-dependent dehydrogenase